MTQKNLKNFHFATLVETTWRVQVGCLPAALVEFTYRPLSTVAPSGASVMCRHR